MNDIALFQITARTALSPDARRRLDGLLAANDLDWKFVLAEGSRNGILPLLGLHLRDRPEVPEAVREALRVRQDRVARSNLYLTAQLARLGDALARRDVPVVALKGPAVAVALYPDLSLREFGDLDLLVRRRDLTGAIEAVRELGFEPWKGIEGGQRAAMERVEYARAFTRSQDDLDLDLHWDVARSFFARRVEPERLWDATVRSDALGGTVRSLPLPYLLCTLCVHGAKHGPFPWPRIKWICDVAELIRGKEEFDWANALVHARSLGCERMVLLGLALAAPLVDDDLPGPVTSRLEGSPEIGELAGRVWGWLAAPSDVRLSLVERAGVDMALIDRRRDRAAYLWRRVVTPTHLDWETASLPDRLAFLYLPLRVLRLTWRYGSAPARLRRLVGRGPGGRRGADVARNPTVGRARNGPGESDA